MPMDHREQGYADQQPSMPREEYSAQIRDVSGARNWSAADTGAIPRMSVAPTPAFSTLLVAPDARLLCVQAGSQPVPPAVLPGTPKVRTVCNPVIGRRYTSCAEVIEN